MMLTKHVLLSFDRKEQNIQKKKLVEEKCFWSENEVNDSRN